MGSLPFTKLSTGDKYYYDRDRIQATERGKSFYYPAINSYRVQGTVLGLSTNAIDLFTGQIGQFPMFCFTSQGIWTMGIGSGETLINTITPLTREDFTDPVPVHVETRPLKMSPQSFKKVHRLLVHVSRHC